MHAVVLSVGLHAAWFALVSFNNANTQVGGLAAPPVSSLQARIFTYQRPAAQDADTESTASEPAHAADAGTQTLATDVVPAPPQLPSAPTPVKPAGEKVWDSASLDASPVLVSAVTLEYPASAQNREGLVTLELVVGSDGQVKDVSVVEATPPGFFEAAAVEGFRNARFTPGLLGGLGVMSRLRIEVEFMPLNRGGSVSGQR